MLENTFKHVIRDKTLRKNPLAVYLRPFTTSLIEDGYPDRTIQWKLELVSCFGQWLRRSRFLIEEINEQLIEIKGHRLHCSGIVVNAMSGDRDRLEPLALEIARALPGLWGYVGVDIIVTPAGPVVIEINPRLTTSYVGLKASIDRNPAGLILSLLQGDNEPMKFSPGDRPVKITLFHAG